MGVSFADYLCAKYPLDERSLNRPVYRQLTATLAGRQSLRCLDVGTGNGAMLKRLLECLDVPQLALTGLDQQAGLLNDAASALEQALQQQGYAVAPTPQGLTGRRGDKCVEVELVNAVLTDFSALPGSFDLITAHAFMDIVPLQPSLRRFADWLAPGGLFYATLNYDGDTALFPLYRDAVFEQWLLACYDESMEQRRVDGLATGGRRCGRRLHAELLAMGFTVPAYGSSDWHITPVNGAYQDADDVCLRALLDFMRAEAEAARFDAAALRQWHAVRLQQIETAQLGMIIHQLDLLAAKSGAQSTGFHIP
ncbi:MAG: class I SAM-dependent methyltransferase [Methylococcaceae bacterium]|nr:MAG: class I SAM-dependent methyltransferase [Methylococcaceae bacterium]